MFTNISDEKLKSKESNFNDADIQDQNKKKDNFDSSEGEYLKNPEKVFEEHIKQQATTDKNGINLENLDNIRAAAQRLTSVLSEKEQLIKHLESEIDNLCKKNQQCVDKLRTLYADFENSKRHHEIEKQNLFLKTSKDLFKDLTNLLDNFDRCSNLEGKIKKSIENTQVQNFSLEQQKLDNLNTINFLKGFDMMRREISNVMKKYNVEPIIVNPGDKFDFEIHDAVQAMPSKEYEPGCIAMLLSPGYKIQGEVLKHAKVIVSE